MVSRSSSLSLLVSFPKSEAAARSVPETLFHLAYSGLISPGGMQTPQVCYSKKIAFENYKGIQCEFSING